MKILIVHNFYQQAGGEDAVVASEMELLKKNGHEVSLFSVHNDDLKTPLQKLIAAVRVVYNFKSRRALLRLLKKERPDIMHVHNFFPMLSPSVFDASWSARIPSVLTLHNFRTLCPSGVLYFNGRIVERSLNEGPWWAVPQRVYHKSFLGTLAVAAMIQFHRSRRTWEHKVDCFIALTPFAKKKFSAAIMPPDRLMVKGNAAEAPDHQQVKSSTSRFGALYVGRLSEEKGPQVLMSAWEGVQYPLRVCGIGPLSESMQAHHNPTAKFIGQIDREKVRHEMLAASFLVLPSVCYEMFPMTLAEAFGCGLPVIVSRLGALADLVENGVTGVHFEPNNPEDLRRVVRWAIENPDEMRKLGANARAEYDRKFTQDVNYKSLMNIYIDAIGKNGQRTENSR